MEKALKICLLFALAAGTLVFAYFGREIAATEKTYQAEERAVLGEAIPANRFVQPLEIKGETAFVRVLDSDRLVRAGEEIQVEKQTPLYRVRSGTVTIKEVLPNGVVADVSMESHNGYYISQLGSAAIVAALAALLLYKIPEGFIRAMFFVAAKARKTKNRLA